MNEEHPEPPHTGLDPVDRVLAREANIAALPVTEQAAAYEVLHEELERLLNASPGSLPAGLIDSVTEPGSDAAGELEHP